jgi:histidinol phosphatase-like enzyme
VNCDLGLAFVVGDQLSDLEAAWTVGSCAILVLSGETVSPPTFDARAHLVARDVSAAAAVILAA